MSDHPAAVQEAIDKLIDLDETARAHFQDNSKEIAE
ncbi:hypothetical protein FHT70_003680 [Rhizobium sp. BK049]|nr:hypothetical protein [Rhizobium sp. BK049]